LLEKAVNHKGDSSIIGAIIAFVFIYMGEELAFIGNYPELKKIRMGGNLTIEYTMTGEPENLYIAPMMLIAFVENVLNTGCAPMNQKTHLKLEPGSPVIPCSFLL